MLNWTKDTDDRTADAMSETHEYQRSYTHDRTVDAVNVSHEYDLSAVVCHTGSSFNSGHYTAALRVPQTTGASQDYGQTGSDWILVDDEHSRWMAKDII